MDPDPNPEEIEKALKDLALDLFWTWSHRGDALWARLDPEMWKHTHNPWAILQSIGHRRLKDLADDPSFREDVNNLSQERRTYLQRPSWFEKNADYRGLRGVAYFSMEFGLSEALPLYAGGLGVLAGDILKTASDLGTPIIGVGLLYQEGYFRQLLDAAGHQEEAYPYNEPATMPIQPARDKNDKWLRIPLDLPGRTALFRIWVATVGRTRLYLIDSNDPMNTPSDRGITAKLYSGGPSLRLLQEIALGICGWRLLEALEFDIDVCHINEGHAAFAALERIVSTMRRHGLSFPEALWATRGGNVFTTHTPVEAGFDRFDAHLIENYFLSADGLYADMPIRADDILALGRKDAQNGQEAFNMAYFAMRLSARTNAVSALHKETSRRLFAPLFPRWPAWEIPVYHVTNGVHMPTWDSAAADDLWTRTCGKERWRRGELATCEQICGANDEQLWTLRAIQRRELVEKIRAELGYQLHLHNPGSGARPDIESILDPNALTLGFGRRFTAYKRPDLLLTDPTRLKRLLTNPDTPVQLVIAGKAHPNDNRGKETVRRWIRFAIQEDVRHHIVFLEDYDLGLAEILVQGVDVWINTPRRPFEACGTSGMKILVNGGLNLSSMDGWWDEIHNDDAGWTFGQQTPGNDEEDADSLYRVLEEQIVPEFYDRDESGLPRRWIKRQQISMAHLGAKFCSNRMLLEYVRGFYCPAAGDFARRSTNDHEEARKLAAWEQRLRNFWPHLHFSRVEKTRIETGWHVSVQVQLGELNEEDVTIELVADAMGDEPSVRRVMQRTGTTPGVLHGYEYQTDIETDRPANHFTPRIIARRDGVGTAAELPLIRWAS